MTKTIRAAQPPTLPDPGYGRHWEWEQAATNPLRPKSSLRWSGSLVSRTGSVVGYIREYDNGWGANVKARRNVKGRDYKPVLGAWGSAEVAAEMLLRALRR